MALLLALACGVLLLPGCERHEPPGAAIATSTASARARAFAAPAPTPHLEDSAPQASGSAAAEPPAAAAAESAAAVDWTIQVKPPMESESLQELAKGLLDAVVHDDVKRARGFFFPREPFTPLKDVKDPDAYWVHLFEAYERDIHTLHKRRRDWSDVQFAAFELGTMPQWVAPGEEANKVGYYRTWGAKLRYRANGELHTIKLHTIISWQKGWYITHLLPWKKK
jgi:hypothetical protein